MGHLEFDEKHYEESIPYFRKSLKMLEELGDKANPVYSVDPLMSIGSAYCMIGKTNEGIQAFYQSIEAQEKFLFAEQQLKQDHITLATTFLRLSGCLAKQSNFLDAKYVLSRAYDILVNHPEKQATNSLLEGWNRIDARVASELVTQDDIQFIRQIERERLDGVFKTQSFTQWLKLKQKKEQKEQNNNNKNGNGNDNDKSGSEKNNNNNNNNNNGESSGKVRKLMKKKKKDNKSEL
eukprot:CAMPEP_0174820208 /NCGR_PEP_ID=MMETSP1107-20130205/3889_1 /TAXON_ID=36770 /ORGANISM="Paraphysomonas vestita, Strain GFlagA" /LENGTH=235 /DNA_ID=CAMNT_0016035105 /DNA_START=1304 /DNA_END=2011 /DNA_ORIENTATION=+